MRTAAYLALAVALGGCGSSSGSNSGSEPKCSEARGSYRVCYRLVDGNCQVPNCATITLPSGGPAAGCTSRSAPAPDRCSGTVDESCTDANGTTSFTGDLAANDTVGKSYTAHVAVSVTDANGGAVCSGHFRLEYERL
jgi:hypothetical protein